MTGSRDGGNWLGEFRADAGAVRKAHVCCGTMQSTIRPVICVFDPNTNWGPVFKSKVILMPENGCIPWSNDADSSCAIAAPVIITLAMHNAILLRISFMKRT